MVIVENRDPAYQVDGPALEAALSRYQCGSSARVELRYACSDRPQLNSVVKLDVALQVNSGKAQISGFTRVSTFTSAPVKPGARSDVRRQWRTPI